MKRLVVLLWLFLDLCTVPAGVAVCQEDPSTADGLEVGRQFFREKVKPILVANCLDCHGTQAEPKGNLRLINREALVTGGDSGPVIDDDNPDASILLSAINYDSLEMPPKGKLAQADIDILTDWIRRGAPFDPEEELHVADKPRSEPMVTEEAKQFWAFRPVTRPPVPDVENSAWITNPIDSFILARLQQQQLSPAAPADKATLLRRAYYDLIGLPPSPAEVEEFLRDESPQAFERVVDRLLNSPHYGERWARHWLDLVRYAETNSFERDAAKPHVWKYREYVIRALNNDKPYNEFILEQLAGDELDDVTAESIVATGYYRIGQWDDEPSDPEQALYDDLDDILSTTSQVFLALTINCARCHDHKLDPIPQSEYYQMLAFLRNVRRYGVRAEETVRDASVTSVGEGADPYVLCVKENGSTAPQTHVLIRGNPHAPGAEVTPAFPSVLSPPAPHIIARSESTGRRRALAEWIASETNPLTARVMANRLWQYHFGRGIVRSSNNFGQIGDRPTHPELLDWLASEFVERGWRLKDMHRLIMLSSTYRMSSQANTAAFAKDPENDLLWRFDMRRLSAEEVRDSILYVNGSLNLAEVGGRSIYPRLAREVLQTQSQPGNGWSNSTGSELARRSVYIHIKRSLLTPLMVAFDTADPDSSCPVRFTTTLPTQALMMLNSEFLQEQSAVFAEFARDIAGDSTRDQVQLILSRVLQREPTPTEVDKGVQLIESMVREDQVSANAALANFCLVALNLNAFVYLD